MKDGLGENARVVTLSVSADFQRMDRIADTISSLAASNSAGEVTLASVLIGDVVIGDKVLAP